MKKMYIKKLLYATTLQVLLLCLITACGDSEGNDDSLSALLLAAAGTGTNIGSNTDAKARLRVVNWEISNGSDTITIFRDSSCTDSVTSVQASVYTIGLNPSQFVELDPGTYYAKFGSSQCSKGFELQTGKDYLLGDSINLDTDGSIIFAETTSNSVCSGQAAIRFANTDSSSDDFAAYNDSSCTAPPIDNRTVTVPGAGVSEYICYDASALDSFSFASGVCGGFSVSTSANKNYVIVSAGTSYTQIEE